MKYRTGQEGGNFSCEMTCVWEAGWRRGWIQKYRSEKAPHGWRKANDAFFFKKGQKVDLGTTSWSDLFGPWSGSSWNTFLGT